MVWGQVATMAAPALISAASSMFNKKPKFGSKQIQQYSPEQMRILNSMSSQMTPELMSELYGPIDEGQLYDRFQRRTVDPAMRQFNEQIVPGLQESFAGMGGRGGDAEQYQLASAGGRLSEDLARQFEDVYDRELGARRTGVQNVLGAQPYATQPIYQPGGNPFEGFNTAVGQGYGKGFGDWFSNFMTGGAPTQTPAV